MGWSMFMLVCLSGLLWCWYCCLSSFSFIFPCLSFSSTRPDQTRPDHTRPDQTRPKDIKADRKNYTTTDAWSAPGYMKTNNNENNGGTLCGVPGATCSSGDWRQAYADYLVAYIRFYLRSGVAISHLGFLNEPEFSASYASMRSSGAQAADFIKNFLYPTLVAQSLDEQVGIVCCDSEGWGNQVQMTNAIKSAGAEGMLKAVSSHTYTGGPSGAMITRARVWLSEQCDLNGGWDTKWYGNGGAGEGLTWANNVYSAVVNNNISGYVYW